METLFAIYNATRREQTLVCFGRIPREVLKDFVEKDLEFKTKETTKTLYVCFGRKPRTTSSRTWFEKEEFKLTQKKIPT